MNVNTRGFCALLLLLLPACFSGGISRDCGFGTELDPERGCVTLSTCGPGTIFEEGECIPGGAFACSTGTSLSADGTECIVDVSQCGDGAQLDPSSGRCVATDEVLCGPGQSMAVEC